MMKLFPFCLALLLSAFGFCALTAAQETIRMTDVTEGSGIDFKHFDGSADEFFIMESLSAGLALFDYDLDGDDDIYLLNGASLEPLKGNTPKTKSDHHNALYRNEGEFRFTDVTQESGLGDTGFGLGVAVGDYDNDGLPDVFVNNGGANSFYRNQGDGTFTQATLPASQSERRIGAGASFLDIDADGDLDLFVANYIREDFANHKIHYFKGLPDYPSPLSLQPDKDQLLENLGDGRFQDISESSGIASVAGRSMGVLTFDYGEDGDIDILVANDSEQNFLYENTGKNQFQESSLIAGLAYDYKAKPQASMGIELLDLARDLKLDVFATSFSREFAVFYRNDDLGFFSDRTLQTGSSQSTFSDVTWGVVASDFDNDGATDVFVAAGDLDEQNSSRGGIGSSGYLAQNFMLQGSADGKLRDLKDQWGTAAAARASSRGAATADFDMNGRQDLLILNSRQSPQLIRNESKGQSFIQVRLVGTSSNRDGLGAMVTVTQDGVSQRMQSRSGHSYQSESSHVLHFGLPSSEDDVTVKVQWLGSTALTEKVFAPGRRVTLLQPAAAQ